MPPANLKSFLALADRRLIARAFFCAVRLAFPADSCYSAIHGGTTMKTRAGVTRLRRAAFATMTLACAAGGGRAIAADYTFTIEPDYPPERIQEIYKPLMDYLGKSTGQHFTLTPARNYQ